MNMEIKWKVSTVRDAGILIVFIFFITLIVIPSDGIKRNNPAVLATFLINGIIWTVLLIVELKKHSFSFALINWCFFLFFYFFAASVQYMNGSFPWVDYIGDEKLLTANLILMMWTGGIWCGQNIQINKKRKIVLKKRELPHYTRKTVKIDYKAYLFIIVAIVAWRVANIGIMNLLARSTSGYAMSDSSAVALLLENIMQAAAYFSAILVAKLSPKNSVANWMPVVALLCLLVAYPPTGISRYAAAAIYLGALLTLSTKMKTGRLFVFLFMGAYIVGLPLLNAFRNVGFKDVDIVETLLRILKSFGRMWLAGDYDAYTMFTLSIDYVKQNGITWMTQLIGAVFFWIPRSIWKTKPIGSGAYMATELNWSFTNVSCPLPGEALINMGIIGVVLFSAIIGKMMKRLDEQYWDENESRSLTIEILYPVLVIFFFFMNRGDLMSSMAYMMSYVVVGTILTKILCWDGKYGRNDVAK